MKAFVITIKGHEKSEKSAQRCIDTGKRWGWDIEKFDAITPKEDLYGLCESFNICPTKFVEKYSRTPNCIAAFLSHYTLWKLCSEGNEHFAIFEHDAVIQGAPPLQMPTMIGNIGRPSYGKYNAPASFGWQSLTSKPYFPGAHAYIVSPVGGLVISTKAEKEAMPTDVYLDVRRFHFLQEYYPWIAIADDSFSTIQNEVGCIAKHNYKKGIEISEI